MNPIKRSFVFIPVSLFLLALITVPCQPQQDPPRGDCCYQIFAAGSNLGWASSLLNHTTIRTRLEPADQTIFDDLDRAGRHVETAHACCSAMNPAWTDWAGKQQFLRSQVNAIRQRPIPVIRGQVAFSIAGTYGWAGALRVRVFNEQRYEHDTCAEKYFKLGFKIAYAQQTLGIAQEMRQSGNNQWLNVVEEARGSLREALQVLVEYWQVRGCTDIQNVHVDQRLNNVIRTNPQDPGQMKASYDFLVKTWEDLQAALTATCEGVGEYQPPSDPSQAVGRWLVHHGGVVGTATEYQEDHRGTMLIQNTGAGLRGSLQFESPFSSEALSGVSLSQGILRFNRPNGQTWQGPVQGNQVVGGTFDFGTARYRWWAEKVGQQTTGQPIDCIAKYCPVCTNSVNLLGTSTRDCENCKSKYAAEIAQCNAQNSAHPTESYGLTTDNWAGVWVCQAQGSAPMYMTITGQGTASKISALYPEQAGVKQATATATSITSLTGTHAEGEEEMHREALVWRGSWAITVNGSELSLERQDYNTRWHGSYRCGRQK